MIEHKYIQSRPLGKAEKINWLLDLGACTNFVVMVEVSGHLSEENLRNALEIVRHRHPMLRTSVLLKNKDNVHFEPADDQPLELEIFDDLSADAWISELESKMNISFDVWSYPLTHITWFRKNETESTIVMTFNHAIADAVSAAHLLLEILKYADKPSDNYNQPEPKKPLPAVEDLYPKTFRGISGVFYIILYFVRAITDLLKVGFPKQIPGYNPAFGNERKLKLIPLEFDETTVVAMIEKCRKENTTIHGMLMAAHMVAIQEEFGVETKTPITIISAVNLRGRLDPAPDDTDVGYYVTLVNNLHSVAPDDDRWALAREAKNNLTYRLDKGEGHILWSIFPNYFLSPPDETGAAKARKAGASLPMHIFLSNIGNIGSEDRIGNIKVRSLRFGLAPPGSLLVSTLVSSIGGRMYINFVFDISNLAEERCLRISQRIKKCLYDALL